MITRNQKKNLKSYCSEPLELVENYQQAKSEGFAGWCIHHRLEIKPDGTRVSRQELKDNGLYYDRPANELVFMRTTEHKRLHWIGNNFNKGKHLSEETCKKIAEANKGKHRSAETRKKISSSRIGKSSWNKGKHLSEDTCRKMSESAKGKTFSEESRLKMSEAKKGIHWWNDGLQNKFARECPGEGWKRGRLKN